MKDLSKLLKEVRACNICQHALADGVRPIVQLSANSRILIAGQAPGRKVHTSGIPFDDASGDRLRSWLAISSNDFYNENKVAILPMGFCYPGTGKSGDLPPRPECAKTWRASLLEQLPALELTIVIGQYAQAYHLNQQYQTVTEHVRAWQTQWPRVIPLPHPSPRNNRWLKANSWFEKQLLPPLQARVADILSSD
ncbi:uracil-DNA glycosylase family protein [Thalassotalea sp. PLHSN55]|uniref:uracil-DNA glycosylase family protein n=1 Tax=Thalassotalea sp. PLHSN55 TaxID=3435888 RepID=UPI003F83AAF8